MRRIAPPRAFFTLPARRSLKDPSRAQHAPKRRCRPHPHGGLILRREWLPNGCRLVFTGPEAKEAMIESVIAEIERQYGPPPG